MSKLGKILKRYDGFGYYGMDKKVVKALAAGLQMVHEDNLRRTADWPEEERRQAHRCMREQYRNKVYYIKYMLDYIKSCEWVARNYKGKRVKVVRSFGTPAYRDMVYKVREDGRLEREDGTGMESVPVSWKDIKAGKGHERLVIVDDISSIPKTE